MTTEKSNDELLENPFKFSAWFKTPTTYMAMLFALVAVFEYPNIEAMIGFALASVTAGLSVAWELLSIGYKNLYTLQKRVADNELDLYD